MEAIELCQSRRFDLVLSDFNMPGMSGLGFIKQLRAMDGYDKTPVFMITTEHTSELAEKGKKLGIELWLLKPFDPEKLIEAIKRVLDVT